MKNSAIVFLFCAYLFAGCSSLQKLYSDQESEDMAALVSGRYQVYEIASDNSMQSLPSRSESQGLFVRALDYNKIEWEHTVSINGQTSSNNTVFYLERPNPNAISIMGKSGPIGYFAQDRLELQMMSKDGRRTTIKARRV